MRERRLRFVIILAVMGVSLFVSHQAKAENPVNWHFDVTSNGADASWDSSSFVDSWPEYDYDYEITVFEVELSVSGWLDLTGEFDPADLIGSGTASGPPPVVFFNESVDEPGVIALDININIDASGYGHATLSNVTLGTFLGQDLEAIRIGGNLDLIGVPEPMSLLLVLTGVGFLAARRRQIK